MFRRMISFLIFLSFGVNSATAACIPEPGPSSPALTIRISALYPNPKTGEKEWIELENTGKNTLDLGGYTLEDATQKPWTPTGTLEAGERMSLSGFTFQLNNSNETVVLKTNGGTTVDTWSYEQSTQGEIIYRNTASAQPSEETHQSQTPALTQESEPTSPSLATPTLYPIFSEAFPNPAGSDEHSEWIELYNPHGESIDLNGLYLDDSEGGSSPYKMEGKIGAESYAIFSIDKTRITLNNTTDSVRLLGINKEVLWEVIYQSGKEGQSYAQIGAETLWTDPSPEEENSLPQESLAPQTQSNNQNTSSSQTEETSSSGYQNGDLSEAIELTEVFPNPEGPDTTDEWIELTNGGQDIVNLGNWTLDDGEGGSKPYIFPDDAIIAPGQTFVISRSESKIALNNSNEALILKDFSGEIMDELDYQNSVEDQSYAKIKIEDALDLQASLEPVQKRTNYIWEWGDPSPGHLNPKWEQLTGTVLKQTGNQLDLESGGKKWALLIEESQTTDPLLYKAGNILNVQMIAADNGLFKLMNAELEKSAPMAKEEIPKNTRYWVWISVATLLIGASVYWKHKNAIENTPPSILE